MKNEVLKKLGYKNNIPIEINKIIDDVINEVEELSSFSYVYEKRQDYLPFLDKYSEFLKNCDSYLLIATTLGHGIDKRIKHYQMIDTARALIFDVASSCYIEIKADEFEKQFQKDRTYRFCPGYENTPLDDNENILNLLKNLKPGISILDSKLMIPSKSIVGIIGLGSKKEKSCNNCIVKNCKYKEEGVLCFKK